MSTSPRWPKSAQDSASRMARVIGSLRMLPAIAVRELVPSNAWIIYADDEAPPCCAVSAAANDLAQRRKLATRCQAAPSHLTFACQHRLEPIRPPHELHRRSKISLTPKATAIRRDAKVRCPHA